MAVIIPQIDIPENCVKCHEMGLQEMLNCTLIYRGCANCGRHPHCPIKSVKGLIEKIDNIDLNRVAREYADRFYEFQLEVIKLVKEYCGAKEG